MSNSVSVVISSFNYERFLADAIGSALAQEEPAAEVIVVDDGSSDGSREVIAGFGSEITAVFKTNGGQASALNLGYEHSRGDVVIFLDSDDMLLPGATREAARAIASGAAKAHWPMPVIDGHGQRTGATWDPELAQGDLREHVVSDGPFGEDTMPSPPMSGNAFAREVLEQIMPIPEEVYRAAADEYLFALAPAFGPIVSLEPQSLYRMHGANEHAGWSFEQQLAFQRAHHAAVFARLSEHLRDQGTEFDLAAWSRVAWWLRVSRVVGAIEAHVPPGERFALIDDYAFGIEREFRGREAIQIEDADDLRRLEDEAIAYVVIAWMARWWIAEYPELARTLRARFRPLVEDQDVTIFARTEA